MKPQPKTGPIPALQEPAYTPAHTADSPLNPAGKLGGAVAAMHGAIEWRMAAVDMAAFPLYPDRRLMDFISRALGYAAIIAGMFLAAEMAWQAIA